MSRFGAPFIPQYGFHPRQYVLAEPSDIPGEYLPPRPEIPGYYQHSFVPPTVLGWVHQGDTQPSSGNVGPQSGERTLDDDTIVHFEESGPVAGPSNFQTMPGAHEQQLSAVDDEEVRVSGPFPHQLHSLIEDPRAAGLIYWCPKGKEFIVPDSEALGNAKLLPKYFKHNNVRLA
ncbi:hypothetical protein M407DRAFT_8796 [Tulasnella calospora MUT 4182]|uniref:HSF-type DNA-binding domain-containing protein n=1 Tax=Tulasnella calospora MUT 4182 TaxID=1051891 RepID=A0A0C3QF52_9AGAM|nr:hypothetical protein M407DRAFT_8796 [Tulasnella calospora MUT 4182]